MLDPQEIFAKAKAAVPYLAQQQLIGMIAVLPEQVIATYHYQFTDGKQNPDLIRQLFFDNADRLGVQAGERALFDPARYVGIVASLV